MPATTWRPTRSISTRRPATKAPSFERTYRRAALVLWPSDRIFAVLSQAGLPVTLPYLDDLTQRWADSAGDRQSPLWREAHDLAGHMLAQMADAELVSAQGQGPERRRPDAQPC